MQVVLVVILIGLIGGVAIGFQAPLSSLISQRIGTLESVFIVHFGGALAALVPLIMQGGGKLSNWRQVPWYALGAGLFGLVVIGAISYTIPRLGIAATITLSLAGQLLIGLGLDHFGVLGTTLRPLELPRLIGVGVVFVGVWLVIR